MNADKTDCMRDIRLADGDLVADLERALVKG